jgi:hypothetical protein
MHLHHHHICTEPTRPSDLHVIAVISNPVRYNTRTRLFRDFMDMMELSGATLWVVEAVHGNRPPSVAKHGHPHHIIVRCDHELWLKENLINIGAAHLPRDAKYIMWMDADIEFQRDDWALETIETLQNYAVVQPFSHVVDYGPHHQILQTHKGFAYCYNMGEQLGSNNKLGGWKKYGGPYWHPGYAFAYRTEAWNAVGGMLDRAIAGAGDYHMACGLIGQAPGSRIRITSTRTTRPWWTTGDAAPSATSSGASATFPARSTTPITARRRTGNTSSAGTS